MHNMGSYLFKLTIKHKRLDHDHLKRKPFYVQSSSKEKATKYLADRLDNDYKIHKVSQLGAAVSGVMYSGNIK